MNYVGNGYIIHYTLLKTNIPIWRESLSNKNKTFVLDTNVLLFDPSAINKFGNNNVFIPLIVIEELDRFKKDQNENGRNARHFARLVDELRAKSSLVKGVPLASGGNLRISILREPVTKHIGIDLSINDNLILANTLYLKEAGEDVILITKDINLRLKADALGVAAEDYETSEITIDELYSGSRMFEIEASRLAQFDKDRFLSITEEEKKSFFANEYMIVHEIGNPQHRHLGRYHEKKGGIVPLIKSREGIWGIHPKNVEQQFAFDALLNHEISLVSLVGKAGTGKTLLAIAAGLECAVGQQQFSRVLV
jgi:PhoH-like ATPase